MQQWRREHPGYWRRPIEIAFGARFFVQGFLAYGKDSFPLMRLYRN